jgi:hypothetical protein
MELFIQIKDGQPFEHPILENNFRQAFPDVDTNNLPPEFARFERTTHTLGVYEVRTAPDPTYEFIDGVYKDVWHTRQMTVEEITAKQQSIRDAFNTREQAENWSAWTLDEATCIMVPPIPRPEPDQTKLDARIFTFWCGADNNWKDTPVYPEGNYKFDFIAWEWVPVVNES